MTEKRILDFKKYFPFFALAYFCGWIIFNLIYFLSFLSVLPFSNDFNHYYASSWLVLKGENPYCVLFKTLPLSSFNWSDTIPSATNPPNLLLITAPLGSLPPRIAWVAWLYINVGCVVASIKIVLRNMPSLSGSNLRYLFVCGLFGSYAFLDNFYYAQTQPILLFFVLLGWEFLKKKRFLFVGLFWGLAVAIKPLPWLLLIWLLFTKKWMSLCTSLATILAVSSITVAVFGINIWSKFLECSVPIINSYGSFSLWNVSIPGTLFRLSLLLGGTLSFASFFLPSILVVVTGVFVMALTFRESRYENMVVAITLLLSFISFPVAWPSYLISLFLIFAVCVEEAIAQGNRLGRLFVLWVVLNLKPAMEFYDLPWPISIVRSLAIPLAIMLLVIETLRILIMRKDQRQETF